MKLNYSILRKSFIRPFNVVDTHIVYHATLLARNLKLPKLLLPSSRNFLDLQSGHQQKFLRSLVQKLESTPCVSAQG